MRFWIVLVSLLLSFGQAWAEDNSSPGEKNFQCARFPAGATAVTVDVLDLTNATQIGNNVATTRQQLDSVNSDHFCFRLDQVAGYPATCEVTDLIMVFSPDGANCNSTPASCASSTSRVGGSQCRMDPNRRVTTVYADALVAGLGISQAVRDFYNRRGTEPVKWRKIETAEDQDFSSPSHTVWEVFFYEGVGAFPRLKCTVATESDPNVSLPSGC